MSETSPILNSKRFNPFRLIARILAVLIIIQSLFPLIPMVLNHSYPLVSGKASGNLVVFGCGFGIYFIGLLIGFKWEFLGGLISIVFLVIAIIYFIYYESNYRIYILIFILMIPCILYIISWYFHREFEINHILHENSKDEYI